MRNALRLGQHLAAEAPPQHDGWRAWVHIRPILDGPTFHDAREEWTQQREAEQYATGVTRYALRRVELSPWHLQPEWADDLDVAMQERPVPDEQRMVVSETEVAAALKEWGIEPEQLRPPAAVDYPEPPPALGTGSLPAC